MKYLIAMKLIMLKLCNKGPFKIYPSNDKSNTAKELSLADLSVKIFENHYDARFGMAQAIPVAINEISIRLLWAIMSRFYCLHYTLILWHGRDWLSEDLLKLEHYIKKIALILLH